MSPTNTLQSLLGTAKERSLSMYRSGSTLLTHTAGTGTNIFTKEWDVLLVLDTLRVDALRELQDEYEFLVDIGQIKSVGGSSPEWMARTFTSDHARDIAETGYVSSNVYSTPILEDKSDDSVLDPTERKLARVRKYGNPDTLMHHDFGHYEQLSPYQIEIDDERICPPRHVTDRALSVSREQNFDRLILHYMPPHRPYIATANQKERGLHQHERNPWKYIQETGDKESVFETYLDMARWVLDDVKLLLDNLDADRVVITADHGEAFGEYMVYGHHTGSLHPHIRHVPWVETTATDSGSYTPTFNPDTENPRSTEETLEALGYI